MLIRSLDLGPLVWNFCSLLLNSISLLFCQTLVVNTQIGVVDQDAKIKPTITILGTYHMRTPGNNVVNPIVADVSTPERQKQIVELVEKLKKFKPTKIAVEIDIEDDAKIQEVYNQYLSGHYQLSKSETNQIGFRLAKELGHKKVYAVDWNEFTDDPLYNYEEYAAKDAALDSFLKGVYRNLKQELDAQYQKLLPLSIKDQLILLNQQAQMDKDHQRYFDLLRIGLVKEYVGANYLSWWYRRNMIILANIIRITESPNDRILVIYGTGHSKLLTQFAKESAFYNVESPLNYLKNNK